MLNRMCVCGDRSWVRRADIFSGSGSGAFLDLVTITSRQRADNAEPRFGRYITATRALGPRSESQVLNAHDRSIPTGHATGTAGNTAVRRSSTARLTRARVVRRHRTALSALPGRQPRGGRDATIAATAAAARTGRPASCQRHTSHRAVAHTNPLDRNTSDSNQHCRARGEAAARKRSLVGSARSYSAA